MTINRKGASMSYILRGMIINASKGKPNLWRRWDKKAIIPCEVLVNIWDYGVKFCPEAPNNGMKLGTFLEWLWNLYISLPKGKDKNAALHLYVDTVQSELSTDWKKKVKSKKRN